MQEQSRQLSFDELSNDDGLSIPPLLSGEPPRPARLPPSSESLVYVLERSARRKSTIQISVLPDLTVRVVAPVRTPRSRIDAMVGERQAWILKRRDEVWISQLKRVERRWESGERLPYLDEELELRIRPVAGQKVVQAIRKDSWLDVRVPAGLDSSEPIVRVVHKWYSLQAQRVFAQRILHYAEPLGVEPMRVLVRNQSSRWGSCASDGSLRFCWRLILAPQRVLDYVVVHELSHLRHPHHQRPFWACVESILPQYNKLRAELKRDGNSYTL